MMEDFLQTMLGEFLEILFFVVIAFCFYSFLPVVEQATVVLIMDMK